MSHMQMSYKKIVVRVGEEVEHTATHCVLGCTEEVGRLELIPREAVSVRTAAQINDKPKYSGITRSHPSF